MQIEDMGGCVRDWMDVSPGTAGQAILPGEFWGGGAPLSGEARRRRVRRGRWAAPAMQAEPVSLDPHRARIFQNTPELRQTYHASSKPGHRTMRVPSQDTVCTLSPGLSSTA